MSKHIHRRAGANELIANQFKKVLPKTRLGMPGYSAVLFNLPTSLKQYEGATTSSIQIVKAPCRKSSGIFTIEASRRPNEKLIHINLRGKHLNPIVDKSVGKGGCLELAKLSKRGYYYECMANGSNGPKQSGGHGMNNRSSVRLAYTKFTQQFRKAIRMREIRTRDKGTLKDVLYGMDEDGNGALDKHELLLGAHTVGIAITPHELEMIWPLFGPFDVNGNIEINHMLKLMANKGGMRDQESTNFAIFSLQRLNRLDRIQKKTKLADTLGALTFNIRTSVLAQLRKRRISPKQSFQMFDTDNNSVIDKTEFFYGLQEIGVKISDAEMEQIWPLFNLDEEGTITNAEWMTFVNEKSKWSYKLIEDKFSNIRSHAEDANQAKAHKTYNLLFNSPQTRRNLKIYTAKPAPQLAQKQKNSGKVSSNLGLYKQVYHQLRAELEGNKVQ
jgi:Ca2+-binding EF-hand superfamily protein